MAQLLHEKRFGRFTSSQIGRLCALGKRPMTDEEKAEDKRLNPKSKKTTIEGGFSATGLSYIEEKVYEERLGRRIQNESSSRPTSYGRCSEIFLFGKLDISHVLTSEVTIDHESIENWSGSPDGYIKSNGEITVFDIKNPYTLIEYCRMADICISKDVAKFKEEYPLYYWQLVSGAILIKAKYGKIIIGMPYLSELPFLREIAENSDESEKFEFYWISAAIASGKVQNIPHILPNTYYKDTYSLNFEVPKEDVEFLTQRVLLANEERKKWA